MRHVVALLAGKLTGLPNGVANHAWYDGDRQNEVWQAQGLTNRHEDNDHHRKYVPYPFWKPKGELETGEFHLYIGLMDVFVDVKDMLKHLVPSYRFHYRSPPKGLGTD